MSLGPVSGCPGLGGCWSRARRRFPGPGECRVQERPDPLGTGEILHALPAVVGQGLVARGLLARRLVAGAKLVVERLPNNAVPAGGAALVWVVRPGRRFRVRVDLK